MLLERIKFMKVNKHKRFSYSPRYYDPHKERIEEIKKKYRDREENSNISDRSQLRSEIESSWGEGASYKSQARKANLRLIVILAILVVAAYFFLHYVDVFSSSASVITIK